MAIPESLSTLHETLLRFQQNPFEWSRLCGEEQQLHIALRDAVLHGGDECLSVLEACRGIIDCDQAMQRLEIGYGSGVRRPDDHMPPDLLRWRGNALALIATAHAAAIVRNDSQSWPEFWTQWERAAVALGAKNETSRAHPQWPALRSPERIIEEACRLARQHRPRWPIETLRHWTLYWLPDQFPSAERTLEVPIGVYRSDGAFIARLFLEVLLGDSHELVEHPLGALQRLGGILIGTLKNRYGQKTQHGVRWRLAPDKREPTTLIEGDSLDGAVAVALRCISMGKPFDRGCLIVAKVDENVERLVCVEEERAKLQAAADLKAAIQRAGVGVGTKVRSLIPDFAGQGLEVRELGSVCEAVEFASGQLSELQRVLQIETRHVLEDAASRIRERKFENWQDLDALFVSVKVARGLRPRLSQAEYEQLERQRREGQHQGLNELAWRRRDADNGRADLREERTQAELRRVTVDWEHVRAGMQRGIVLGDPGFGKTMLLWHEVGRRNEEWLAKIGRSEAGLGQAEVALFVRALELAQWAEKGEGVLEAIIAHRRGPWRASDATVKLVGEKLEQGGGLIAIDALDEVPLALRDKLDGALAEFGGAHPRARVLLSSRLVGYTRAPIAVAEDDQFETLAFEPAQMEQAVTKWFHPDAAAGAATRGHIQSQTSVFGDLRCPLLLRLACALIAEAQEKGSGLPTWERRGELYEAFLKHGVNRWSETARPGMQARGVFLDFAGEVALELWKTDARRTLWEQGAVARKIDVVQKVHRALEMRSDLIRDLCDSGILGLTGPDDAATPLMFSHRSFGEFLAARSLAEKLENRAADEWSLVDRKAWDPDWQEVIALTAGCMRSQDVPRFLRLLINGRDDMFRHRMVLAALCLQEIPKTAREVHSGLADEISSAVFSFWRAQEFDAHAAYVARALPALWRVNGKLGQRTIRDEVAEGLKSPGGSGWSMGCRLVTAIGVPAATPWIVARLLDGLTGSGSTDAARALARIVKPEAATSAEDMLACHEVYTRLVDHHQRSSDRMGMALRRLRAQEKRNALYLGLVEREATPKVLDQLLKGLAKRDHGVQDAAAKALGRFAGAAQPDALARLLELLRNPNWELRRGATEALRQLGGTAARPNIIAELLQWLRDPKKELRQAALEAFEAIGRAAMQQGVLARLIESVHDPDMSVQIAGVDALGRLCEDETTTEILAELHELLRKKRNDGLGLAALNAVQRIGPKAAVPEVVEQLLPYLSDYRWWEHSLAAVKALGAMGAAAARQPGVLKGLFKCLGYVRRELTEYWQEMTDSSLSEAAASAILDLMTKDHVRIFRYDYGWMMKTTAALARWPAARSQGPSRRDRP